MVSENKVDNKGIDLTKYNKDEIEKFKSISKDLDVNDENSILEFGSHVQKKLSDYSNDFLNNIQSFDSSEADGMMNKLLDDITHADPNKQKGLKGILMKVPGLNKLIRNANKYLKRYESVNNNIDNIVEKMEVSRLDIIKDNVKLNSLFDKNKEIIYMFEDLVISGKMKIQEMKEYLVELKKDPEVEDIDIADKTNFISRLSKRIHDIELTRTIAVQSLPQIRMVQNNNSIMIEKIQSSINGVIPLWKNEISITIALKRQEKIADIQNKIYDTTNKILKSNSEKLKINSIDIAKQNERGIISIETLKEVSDNLIETLTEINKVREEGQKTRESVEKEIYVIEDKLKKSYIENKNKRLK
jgi:uncharacterized protein YaaN involved in tellurite resistance